MKRGQAARPETVANMRVAQAKRFAEAPGVEVPAWVPDDLIGEFLQRARLYGEEKAASFVRALKRGLPV